MNIVFKQHLKVFLKGHMDISQFYVDKVDGLDDYDDLMDFLKAHGEHIAEMLDVEMDCDDCGDKDYEINELKCEIGDMPGNFKNLDDARKFEAFMEHHHKYNATEMDELLK